jgi:hypothetical protein
MLTVAVPAALSSTALPVNVPLVTTSDPLGFGVPPGPATETASESPCDVEILVEDGTAWTFGANLLMVSMIAFDVAGAYFESPL